MGYKTAHTDIGRSLYRAFTELAEDGISINLRDLDQRCDTLMKEIEETAKEVGGNPQKSVRYLEAQEIRSLLNGLRRLGNGTYTFNSTADEVGEP